MPVENLTWICFCCHGLLQMCYCSFWKTPPVPRTNMRGIPEAAQQLAFWGHVALSQVSAFLRLGDVAPF